MILAGLMALNSASVYAVETAVRVRFGLTDEDDQNWNGTVQVDAGRVVRIDGWRFRDEDKIIGTTGWEAATRSVATHRTNDNKGAAGAEVRRRRNLDMADNGVILLLDEVDDRTLVSIATLHGNFQFSLAEIPYGSFVEKLGGAVDLERVAPTQPLTAGGDDNDYPSLAVAPDGTAFLSWVAFTPGIDRNQRPFGLKDKPADYSYLAVPAGGDRLWLRVRTGGQWGEPLPLTGGHGDLYKCSTAVDGAGRAWIFWSENSRWQKSGPAEFEIWARSWDRGVLSAPVNLSSHPGSDLNPVATADAHGRLWVAWQGARDGRFQILERHQTSDGDWTPERNVSSQERSCWAPAIAATRENGGEVAVAWDTYEKGDYDVWLREFPSAGEAGAPLAVANTPLFEACPVMTYDHLGRLWICWEEGGPLWGKDFGAYAMNKGVGLYRDRQLNLRVWANGHWFDPRSSLLDALPGVKSRRRSDPLPVRRPEEAFVRPVQTRLPGVHPQTQGNGFYNDSAGIGCDADGRVWVVVRSREGTFRAPVGSVWLNYAAYYDGSKWVGPIQMPHSDNLLYALPAVAPDRRGLLVAYASDHRQDRYVSSWGALCLGEWSGGIGSEWSNPGDPFINDIFVSQLELPAAPVKLSLVPAAETPATKSAASPLTQKERTDVARCRAAQVVQNGVTLRLRRGEFHRHTEISADGGTDGTIEDMWRYAIDVAAMDWLGCGDHDNGEGREYTWWLTQKTTDAYRIPGTFDPPFSYEHSQPYPQGHRNIIFAQRGVRTLPFLHLIDEEPVVHAPDTVMLYEYLKHFHGICAPHTTATDMGTDWRDHDPDVEPMVEIYQGLRQSYERPDSPRAPTPNDALGGWRPKGFVNRALLAGDKLAFEASSDHFSTHMSYAMVYAESTSREGLLKAMRQRHVYAATTNIVADFRCRVEGRDYMLGDAFSASVSPSFHIALHGGAPFAKVTLIKDDQEVQVWQPNAAEAAFDWSDQHAAAGRTSYYYVRAEQTDGEIAWISPMWVSYRD